MAREVNVIIVIHNFSSSRHMLNSHKNRAVAGSCAAVTATHRSVEDLPAGIGNDIAADIA